MFLKSSLQGYEDMRTMQQHRTEDTMFETVRTILSRSRATVLEDTVGVIALFLLLFAVLSMPGAA
jgi:hypothetical protein